MPRAREFETEVALDQCLDLFWAKGFTGVSVSDLEEATGLGRQSLYTAFGNKEAIFTRVLERYAVATEAGLAPLFATGAGVADIRRYAKDALAVQRRHGASGCLLVKTLWDRGLEDREKDGGALRKLAQASTKRVRAAFRNALDRAEERGEVSRGDSRRRADLCFAAINGLAALRRAGVSEAEALLTLEPLLDSWRT